MGGEFLPSWGDLEIHCNIISSGQGTAIPEVGAQGALHPNSVEGTLLEISVPKIIVPQPMHQQMECEGFFVHLPLTLLFS
jgi:hypothetical protein